MMPHMPVIPQPSKNFTK